MCSQIFILSIDSREAAVRVSAFAFLAIQVCEFTARLSGHVSTQQTSTGLIDTLSSSLQKCSVMKTPSHGQKYRKWYQAVPYEIANVSSFLTSITGNFPHSTAQCNKTSFIHHPISITIIQGLFFFHLSFTFFDLLTRKLHILHHFNMYLM